MADRIRLLQIVTRLVVRGASRYVIDLATHLDPEQFELEVLAGSGESAEGSLWEEARDRGLVTHRLEVLQRAVHPARDLAAYRAIYQLIKDGRYDAVHTHISKAGFLGRLAAKRAGIPLIVHTYHGLVGELGEGMLRSRVLRQCERLAARRADVLIAVSEDVKSRLLKLGIGRPTQYRVIPNGIDPGRWRRDAQLELPAHVNGEPVIGCVGSLTREKGMDVLLNAIPPLVERYPRLQVCIVGNGPLRREIESQAQRAGIHQRVLFAGIVEDVRPWLAAFDVFVLASRSEGMPVSLLEAMAMGVPVVASRVGGVPEIVTDSRGGRLVDPGDAKSLSVAIQHVLEAEGNCEVGLERSRWVADRFGLARVAEETARIYKEGLQKEG